MMALSRAGLGENNLQLTPANSSTGAVIAAGNNACKASKQKGMGQQ